MVDAYFLTADSILSTDVAVCLITSDANLLKNSSSCSDIENIQVPGYRGN